MGRRVVTPTHDINFLMRNLLFLLVVCSVSGCIQAVDIDGPEYVKKPVVFGILHPDSLLKVNLTWSRPATTTNPALSIKNAEVTFFENGTPLGESVDKEDGNYSLPVRPKTGRSYKVEIKISALPLITAEDYIPRWMDTNLYVSDRNPSNTNSNPDITYTLKNFLPDNSTLWMGLYSTQYFPDGWAPGCIVGGQIQPGCELIIRKITGDSYVTTASPIFDSFNGFFDPLSNRFSNSSPARVRADILADEDTPTVKFAAFNQGEDRWGQVKRPNDTRPFGENILEITFAGPAYDRYLKSALLAYQNRLTDFDGNLFSPFAEPSPVYSNVTNGLGIFGARNGRYIVLKLNTTYQLTP